MTRIKQELIEMPDKDLDYQGHEIKENMIRIDATSKRNGAKCPHCGKYSDKPYARDTREFQDLPIQGKTVYYEIEIHKYFCLNPACEYKTFAERFTCVPEHGSRTKRLEDKILAVAKHTSTVKAAEILNDMGIQIGNRDISNLLKKNRN